MNEWDQGISRATGLCMMARLQGYRLWKSFSANQKIFILSCENDQHEDTQC